MHHRIREAKYRLEIVTFIWDFSDHLDPGDTIVSAVADVLVSSGNDDNPLDLLKGSPVITNGTIISQRIRRGIPGTIYTITITVTTVGGDVFEDYAYLALLPLPSFTFSFFLVTQLYPIEMYYERLVSSVNLIDGKIFDSIIMVPEGIVSSVTLGSGTLFGGSLSYAMTTLNSGGPNGNEGIISSLTLINGTLFGSPMSYNMISGEGLVSSVALGTGTLFGSPLTYTMTSEGIKSYLTLLGGTLT